MFGISDAMYNYSLLHLAWSMDIILMAMHLCAPFSMVYIPIEFETE